MYSQVIGHKKTLSNCILMKICTQIYEGLSKPKKKKNLKMSKRNEQALHQEEMQIANKHMKIFSTS